MHWRRGRKRHRGASNVGALSPGSQCSNTAVPRQAGKFQSGNNLPQTSANVVRPRKVELWRRQIGEGRGPTIARQRDHIARVGQEQQWPCRATPRAGVKQAVGLTVAQAAPLQRQCAAGYAGFSKEPPAWGFIDQIAAIKRQHASPFKITGGCPCRAHPQAANIYVG